jgi:hypothetical protein
VLARKFSGRLKLRPIIRIGRKLKPVGSGFTNYLEGKEKMKSYQTGIATLILTFAFSTSAFGDGIIHTEKTPPPPPPTTNGIIHTEGTSPEPEEDTLTEIALILLQTLIPLL